MAPFLFEHGIRVPSVDTLLEEIEQRTTNDISGTGTGIAVGGGGCTYRLTSNIFICDGMGSRVDI